MDKLQKLEEKIERIEARNKKVEADKAWRTSPPLDLFGGIGSHIVLKRNRVGKLGFLILLSLPLWLFAFILP